MALYQPANITPDELYGYAYIDATQGLAPSWQVTGDANTPMVAYQIDIMRNDSASTQLYSTGKVTLDTPFYGNDEFGNVIMFTATKILYDTLLQNGIVNSATNEYKMLITQWWNETDSVAQSSASVFKAIAVPYASIVGVPIVPPYTRYVSSKVQLTANYVQPQNVPFDWAQWKLYKANTGELVIDSGKLYNVGPLQYTFDGLLDGRYKPQLTVCIDGFSTPPTPSPSGIFTVDYEKEAFRGVLQACPLCDTDAIEVKLPRMTVEGTAIGDIDAGYQYAYTRTIASEAGEALTLESPDSTAAPTRLVVEMPPYLYPAVGTAPAHFNKRVNPSVQSTSAAGAHEVFELMFSSSVRTIDPVISETLYLSAGTISGETLSFSDANDVKAQDTTLYIGVNGFYGGVADLTGGTLTITYGHIASYNGESIPEPWISNRDDYYPGTTPSIGAEVVYPLDTPIVFTATPISFSGAANTYEVLYQPGCVIQMTYTETTNGNAALIPTDSDGISWGTRATPIVESGNYTIITESILTQTQSAVLYSIIGANGTNTIEIETYDREKTYIRGTNVPQSAWFTINHAYEPDTTITIQITPSNLRVTFNRGQIDEYVYTRALSGSEWQLGGIQTIVAGNGEFIPAAGASAAFVCRYIWVLDDDISTAEQAMVSACAPSWTPDTAMLTNFTNGYINAGAIRTAGQSIAIYRRAKSASVASNVAILPFETKVFRDYAITNNETYTYYAYVVFDNGQYSAAASSNEITPLSWNYVVLMCSKDSAGVYHVQEEYRFSLDVSTGTYTNNNKPSLQANFTPYPFRQPNTQNYRSGTLTSYAGKAANGKYVDSVTLIQNIRNISVSMLYKFLKTRKGELIRIDTASPITFTTADKYAAQPVRIGMPWAEIGDASKASIIAEEGSDYWPDN